jgi:hypothetical protein
MATLPPSSAAGPVRHRATKFPGQIKAVQYFIMAGVTRIGCSVAHRQSRRYRQVHSDALSDGASRTVGQQRHRKGCNLSIRPVGEVANSGRVSRLSEIGVSWPPLSERRTMRPEHR